MGLPSELHALILSCRRVQVICCRHPATQGHSGIAVYLPPADPALSFPKLPATGHHCYTKQCASNDRHHAREFVVRLL